MEGKTKRAKEGEEKERGGKKTEKGKREVRRRRNRGKGTGKRTTESKINQKKRKLRNAPEITQHSGQTVPEI